MGKGREIIADKSVSVVIACYNSEETIAECIESFLNQTYSPIEIVVVDDGSNDNTVKIAQKYPIRLIALTHCGVAHARNRGIKESSGNIILFAESDGKYAKNYVGSIIKRLDNPTVGCSFGGLGKVWASKSTHLVRYINLRRVAAHELTVMGRRPIIGGWAFRKKIFEEVGVYDENLPCGEDVDLVRRVTKRGYKLSWEPDTYIYHKEPDTIFKLIKDRFRRDYLMKNFRKKWHEELNPKEKAGFFVKTLLLTSVPIFIVLSFYNLLWLILFLFSIFIHYRKGRGEGKLAVKLAFKGKDYLVMFLIPIYTWIENVSCAWGRIFSWVRQ